MNTGKSHYAVALLLVGVVAGCQCNGSGTSRRKSAIEVEKTLVEFGQVQVDLEHEQFLRVHNGGTTSLNIYDLKVDAPFSVREEVPLTLGVGQDITLTLVFKPTVADKRELGQIVISTDDSEAPDTTVTLQGTGIQATAIATPNPVEFGDVQVGESKTLKLTIHNKGTNTLDVTGASFLPDTTSEVTADLAKANADIAAGGSAEIDVTFSPTQMGNQIPGGLRLALAPEQGGELLVTFHGRGVRAVPLLCWQFEGQGMESCTPENAGPASGSVLPVNFPALCDSKVNPPNVDAGTSACGETPYEMKGQMRVRNVGNVPVKFSLTWNVPTQKCSPTGPVHPSDYVFSNAPSVGATTWSDPTVELGPGMETPPVSVTYRPTAECIDEAGDSSIVTWTRQGVGAEQVRQPNILSGVFSGQSKLPSARSYPVSFSVVGTSLPKAMEFRGVVNRGSAELEVTRVELYELDKSVSGQNCTTTDPVLVKCDPNPPVFSDCYQFEWAVDGNPNDAAPITVPVASVGVDGSTKLGSIVFGPDPVANHPTSVPRCVFAKIQTTDPFNPEVISRIQGTAN